MPDELLSGLLMRTALRARLPLRAAAFLAIGRPMSCHPQFPRELPNFLANTLRGNSGWKHLLWNHTCFPLVAPFLDKPQLERLQCWMQNDSRKLGRPGSRVFSGALFERHRYCPACAAEQETQYGERYWQRTLQVPQLHLCPRHGCQLVELDEPFRDRFGISRTVSPCLDRPCRTLKPGLHEQLVTDTLESLFCERLPHLTRAQWMRCYDDLKRNRKRNEIDAAAVRYWGSGWMEQNGIRRTTALLEGRYWHAWWMHLTLIKALDPSLSLRDFMEKAVSK